METIITAIITSLLSGSGSFSIFLSISALIIGGVLYFRKTNIAEVTSVGELQQKQIEGLLDQVKLLSDELAKARKQLTEIHNLNIQLMENVRENHKQIQELEKALEANKE